MNTGIIATRYATALLKLVEETGSGELVAAQVQVIEKALDEVPDFRRAVDDPAVAAVQKISLFEASLKDSMAQELHKFLELLIRNGRICDVRLVLTTFVTEYYRSRHIKRARLVVADPALLDPEPTPSDPVPVEGALRQAQRPALESRLRDLVEKQTGCRLILKTEVNPSLIGGFVFEVEDTVLDASVSRQLDFIRRQFIEKNRRIV
uniref:F0F1 ATP synthase subunit delta n=1 Tax=Candidatus Cryptobacteroides bacterium TaxID=3085639 RepID=UPI00402A27BC